MNIDQIIDAAKQGARVESDMQLSKYLGLSKSAVANWRAGTSYPNTVSCERIAGLTGLPLAQVIGIVGEARAISKDEKAVWRKLAASAAMLLLVIGATPLPGMATDGPHSVDLAPYRAPLTSGVRHYAKLPGNPRVPSKRPIRRAIPDVSAPCGLR